MEPINIKKRGVYIVKDGDDVMYIGSTTCSLSRVEYNHRNWFRLGYTGTKFRAYLFSAGRQWTFGWLVDPYKCTQEEIETIEGEMIRQFTPQFNVDTDPVRSSKRYGRY